ncbi:Kelch domain-containing protein 10 [Thelohanellus kitauei]|uniref:Kelch domain-containing protein 10 n=1 Tax=Thelohanellus kitauei TaxID=669202 RepID=A0A0C2NA65_THEKT|nr:Kelch domain-containing protein 10 [Thelohanellus kitauei]
MLNQPTENEFMPQPRVAHCMACIDKSAIIYGGVAWGNVVCDEMWIYEISSCKFVKYALPNCVKKRCLYSAICAFGSVIYIFGGTSYPLGRYMTNKLLMFNVSTKQWTDLSKISNCTRKIVPKMYNTSISYHSGFIYVIAGTDGNKYLGTAYSYCIISRTWGQIMLNGGIPHPPSLGHSTTFNNR